MNAVYVCMLCGSENAYYRYNCEKCEEIDDRSEEPITEQELTITE